MPIPEITIRPATEADVESVRDLPSLLVGRWRNGGNRRSLVAVRDGLVIGHARGIDNAFHPRSRVLVIEVLPQHRRQGVGTALLAAQQQVSRLPLELKLYASMTGARALAQRFGGVAIQATPPWRYAITPRLRAWAAAHSGTAGPTGPGDGPELLELEIRHYLDQHASWSPADGGALREEFAANYEPGSPSAYDPKLSTVLRRDGRIVAAALVWPYDSELGGNEVSLICRQHGSSGGRADMEACLAETIARCGDDIMLLIDSHVTQAVESAMLRDLPGPSPDDGDGWMVIVAIPVPGGPAPIAMPSGLLPPEARWITDEFVHHD